MVSSPSRLLPSSVDGFLIVVVVALAASGGASGCIFSVFFFSVGTLHHRRVVLHRAEQLAPLLSSSRGKQPLSLDFANLHFLRSHSLHPGAVGDVILRARYYAFCVSKYLDSTDLFLRRRRRRRSSRFFSSQPLLGRPSALVFFFLCAHYPSLSLTALTGAGLPLAHSLSAALSAASLPLYLPNPPHTTGFFHCRFTASHLPISSRGGGDSPNS